MTEAEWKSGTNPGLMLAFVSDKSSGRKLRLFACRCCRDVWHLLAEPASRQAVEAAERFADGLVGREELYAAWESALAVEKRVSTDRWQFDPDTPERLAAEREANLLRLATGAARSWLGSATGLTLEIGLQPERVVSHLRDVVGNPFWPVWSEPRWLTSTVVALAAGVHEEQAFDRLPILADALQEAGCNHPDVLHHCRGTGPHARGCWVVDMLLGKS